MQFDEMTLLMKWIPTVILALSFFGSVMFFMFLFLLFRGLSRLGQLKEISLTLKRIEKLLEGKSSLT